MDIVLNSTQQKMHIPDVLINLFPNKNFCFFDIETTGFSRKDDYIILIGVLYFEDDSVIIKQYFAENLSEEFQLLSSFIEFISNFDVLVNYNGDTFDIPFINNKLTKYNINHKIDTSKSLDLMKIVRSNKELLGLDNYKLKTVEKFLNISREDTISGKESVELYNKYLSSKNENIKRTILKHNYDDIFYLPRLLKIYDLIHDRINFNFNLVCMQNNILLSIDLNNISFKGNMLYLTGYTDQLDLSEQIHYGNSYVFEWKPSLGTFKLRIQLCEGKLSNGNKCWYLNTNDYICRLENQDIVNYNIASNILIIKEKNRVLKNNIRLLIKETIANIFSNI